MNKLKVAKELLVLAKELMADRWDWRQKGNFLREQAKHYTLTFRNKAQEALWNEELTGQISDGMWENTPNTGYEFWGAVKTAVGGSTSLRPSEVPYGVKATFGFAKLTGYVGDRMLEIIRKYEPEATEKTLNAYLTEIGEALRKGEATPRGGTGALPKDIKRIEDIAAKYPNDEAAQRAAAERMARTITDVEKAIRRGRAAEQLGFAHMAEAFLERAKELAK
jgi:hypothetical protein